MGITLPSEAEIRRAVLGLRATPGAFQMLAERFLAARDGGVYRDLTPKGRNSSGTATKGYPDAYAYLPDDRMVVVETTVGDWRAHIRNEDIPGLKKIGVGKVRSFHFFCMTDSEGPVLQRNAAASKREAPENALRTELRKDCGVEQVEIVFLDGLCAALRRPEHLPLLLSLGLNIAIAPFVEIHEVRAAGPPDIAPTPEEFDKDWVVPGSSYAPILKHLRTGRPALVEGRGASGKTSMAIALGRAWGRRGTAYYVDLEEIDTRTPGRMAELNAAIVTLGSPEILLIFDNCHLAHGQDVVELLATTRRLSERPASVFLQRARTTDVPGVEAHIPAACRFAREAGLDDLAVIYQRLAARRRLSRPQPPPPNALERWEPLRGDLIAFCLALAPRLARLGIGGDWGLASANAADYVRGAYLDPLPPQEQQALKIISALSTLEMPTSLQSLGGRLPQAAMDAGLILRTRHGSSGARVRLRLAHHALGRLILEAAGLDALALIGDEIVRRDVFQSSFIGRRLLEHGHDEDAKRVLSLIRQEIVQFPPDVPPGYLAGISQLFQDAGVATLEELEHDLIANIDRFPSGDVPLVGLSGLFGFARDRMPRLYSAAVERLKEPRVMAEVTASYGDAPATAIMSMVSLSENHGLPFTHALLAPLRDPQVVEHVGANLLRQSWPEIDEYLAASAAFDPRHGNFLARLRGTDLLKTRAADFLREPFGTIQQVMFEYPLAAKLLLEPVGVEEWRARDWSSDHDFAAHVANGLRSLAGLGRADLAEELARQAVARREPAMWTPARRASRRLEAIMEYTEAIPPGDVARLAEHLATRGWLRPIYNRTPPAVLVGMLMRLWRHLPPDNLSCLLIDGLDVELGRRLREGAVGDARGAACAVQAAGLLKVFGLPQPTGASVPPLFTPPIDNSTEGLMGWIGLAALSSAPPPGLPNRPWTVGELKGWPPWVASALSTVELWADV